MMAGQDPPYVALQDGFLPALRGLRMRLALNPSYELAGASCAA